MIQASETVGDVLRVWRRRRRRSQLDLSLDADISSRHLSFVESGRSAPSRDVLLRLADRLELPLRERNRLLLAAGLAPEHSERRLDAPEMADVRAAVDTVLEGHNPYPALALDRHWNLLAANDALQWLIGDRLLKAAPGPINVMRLVLSFDGLAPRIENFGEWRRHILDRLRRQIENSGDPELGVLYEELSRLPALAEKAPMAPKTSVAVPLRIRTADGGSVLSLISTSTVFGTATDVLLSELTLECFYPADAQTRALLTTVSEAIE